jgi:hypothetical protein
VRVLENLICNLFFVFHSLGGGGYFLAMVKKLNDRSMQIGLKPSWQADSTFILHFENAP